MSCRINFRAKIFDPTRHSFNPLKGIERRKAQELAELIYTIYPEGSTTLTVRKGKWELAPALLAAKSLDGVHGGEEVEGVMSDLLFNPVVRNALCGKKEFEFDENRVILAKRNRKEIGERAALIIGLSSSPTTRIRLSSQTLASTAATSTRPWCEKIG